MSNHPIDDLMKTTMESLKDMVDVNTIVGDAVETTDGIVIIPISRVSFGFASGGSQYSPNRKENNSEAVYPFGGGSGAGVTVQPVAFIVVGNSQMKLLPVDQGSNIVNNLLDSIPKFVNSVKGEKVDNNDKSN